MEAVNFLTSWVKYLLMIIPVSAGAMIMYFAFRKSVSVDGDEMSQYDKKIRQTLKGAIIATSISGFIEIVKAFYN
ncbi:hypothetical protein [Clostridium butyricum]|uniref:hypothetical protein n=1 Tax=Clostridium butyricum TaxID=1492 RepID=UPI00374E99C5